MANQGTKAKKVTVKPVEKELEVNEFVQEEVSKEPTVEEVKKVWVKDYRELIQVEGVNHTQRGKEYYGVKRES